MSCSKGGKEISEDTQVCGQSEVSPEAIKKKKTIAIFVIVGVLVLCALCLIAVRGKEPKAEDIAVIKTEESAVEETITTEDVPVTEEVTVAEETVSEETQPEETTESVPEENPYELLVSIPVEYMYLRQTAGLGKDIIAEVKTGTYMKWYGESKAVNGREYYKVIVEGSELEGYVNSLYCVNVEFEYSEDDLKLVETDTSIYTYEMMAADIEELCSRYPKWVSSSVIGVSNDGRNLYEVVLGNPEAEKHIMMQAAIHGREYMTTQLVMKMIEYYAYYYQNGKYENVSYADIFDKIALHIVPMTNPDGVTISQLGVDALNNSYYKRLVYQCYERDKDKLSLEKDSNGDMNWMDYYKNPKYKKGNSREITFEEYQTIWKANAAGVDLNNNFDAGWEGMELKKQPSYCSYKGPTAFSEPESRAMAEAAGKNEYECFINYHARGQLIYYDAEGNTPENSQASWDLANLFYQWIKYAPVNVSDGYNVNTGGFGDWVQLQLNKPSVAIENGKRPCPLQIDEFTNIWHRHRETWAMLAMQYYE